MNSTLLDIAETAAKVALSLIPGLGAAGPFVDEAISLANQLFGLGQSAIQGIQNPGLSQDQVDSMIATMDKMVDRVDQILKHGTA